MGEFGEMDNYRWGDINMSGLPHNCLLCDEALMKIMMLINIETMLINFGIGIHML